MDRHANSVVFPASNGPATLMAALRQLDEAGVLVDDISIRRPSLDDVFLALTGHTAPDDETPALAPLGGG